MNITCPCPSSQQCLSQSASFWFSSHRWSLW